MSQILVTHSAQKEPPLLRFCQLFGTPTVGFGGGGLKMLDRVLFNLTARTLAWRHGRFVGHFASFVKENRFRQSVGPFLKIVVTVRGKNFVAGGNSL